MKAQKQLNFEFEVKNDSKSTAIEIEGLANALVKDRIGDLIPKDAWELDDFKKNPIIFFNHDPNYIVGKATAIEPTDDGLKIRVRLSRSKEGKVPYVRDLVQEGILKAFSVGFNDHGSAEKDGNGTNIIKRAELMETSIVSIPMNQDSLFSVMAGGEKSGKTYYTKKALSAKDMNLDSCDNYEDVKELVLNQKGAWVAAAIHNAIYQAQKEGGDRDAIIAEILDGLDASREDLDNIMAGNVTPVPEAVLERAAEVLALDLESLQGLNAGDAEVSKPASEEEAADETPAPEDETPAPEESLSNADEQDKQNKDFQECVSDKITVLLNEGKDRNQAIAQAISMCESENKCSATPDMMKTAIQAFNAKQDGAVVSTPVENSESESTAKDEFNQGQPDITLMKAQLALTGSLIELQKEMLFELRRIGDALLERKEPEEEIAEPEIQPEQPTAASEDEISAEKILRITRDISEIVESQKKLNRLLSS